MLRPSISTQMLLSGVLPMSAKNDPSAEQRRRNFWSFLTWAFFLSEVFGPDGIMPSSAHAAEDEDWKPPQSSGQDAATGEPRPLPPADIDALMEPASQTSPVPGIGPVLQQPAEVRLDAPEAPSPVAVEARDGTSPVVGSSGSPPGDITLDSAEPDGGAAGRGVGSGVDVNSPGFDLTDSLPDVSIATPIVGLSVDLGGVVGAVLDPVTGIVDGLGEGLGQLPVVGGLLEGVTGSVTSLLGSGTDVHDTSDGEGTALSLGPLSVNLGGALASPGQLLFSDTAEPASTTDLMSGGQYTDYGVAMQTGLVGGAIDLTQSLSGSIGNITGALGDVFGGLDSGMFSDPDADEVTTSMMTDEIGLRVAGDALV